METKVVVWKDGSYLFTDDVSWEYELDEDWLVTIILPISNTENRPSVVTQSEQKTLECPSSPNGKHKSGEYIEGAKRCYFCGEAMSDVVTQSEKGVTQEDINELERVEAVMDSILSKAPHYLYADSPMKMYLRPNVMAAMHEYSLLERSRAREEAIQEVKQLAAKFYEGAQLKRVHEELENLKSRQ